MFLVVYMIENIDLALDNILKEEMENFDFLKLYNDLYRNYDNRVKNIFAYLHQNLNNLIGFMNGQDGVRLLNVLLLGWQVTLENLKIGNIFQG